jgi:hypothetical protein
VSWMLGLLIPEEQRRNLIAALETGRPRETHRAYAVGMWDVTTWHDGTLAIAWWAVIVLVVALLSIGGSAAARRK